MSAPSIKITCFENLHVIDIIDVNPYLVSGSERTKSSASIKKGTSRDFIDCKDP